jgi:5-methylthioadenosine/S-adenosylhomocysteine deaminase
MDILIKNANILGYSGLHNISIENNIITEINKGISIPSPEYTISGKDLFITSAFVNAHTHASMSLLRGFSDNLTLFPWLQKIWSIESHFTADDCRVGAELSFLEMIKSGTGMFVDFYFHEDAISIAADKSGLRGFLGAATIEGAFLDQGGSEGLLKITENLCKKLQNHPLLKGAVAPHAPHTCSEETIQKSLDLTDKYDSLLTIHLSETRDDVLNSQKQHNFPPIEWLQKKFNFFTNRKVLAAHCVWIQQKEIDILAKNNAAMAFCPTSGQKLAYGGMAPIPELIKSNVPVCLATDGPASNNTQDMVREMRVGATMISHQRWDPSIIKKHQILAMATSNFRSWLDEQPYAITTGIPADLAIFDFKEPHTQPNINPISTTVYAANGSDIHSTIVNGKVLMYDRNVETLDEENVIENARKTIFRLIDKYNSKS